LLFTEHTFKFLDLTTTVWHINENERNNRSKDRGEASSRLVMLEQADGGADLQFNRNSGDATDPFPQGSSAGSFTADTNPNSRFYNGKKTGFSLVNIRNQSGGRVSTTYQCKSFNILWMLPVFLLVIIRRKWKFN
jgi:hypothetical protein